LSTTKWRQAITKGWGICTLEHARDNLKHPRRPCLEPLQCPAGLAAARAEGRIGGRRKKLDAVKRQKIAESVITGRKSGADMARQPTVSRIVAQHRT
jgi:hypothetical protein